MEDAELARRSIRGFGEVIAALGRWGAGPDAEVRRPDAVGARIPAAAGNPWFDAAVVPLGAKPPADEPALPGCLWTVAGAAPGRVALDEIATPCMAICLDGAALNQDGAGIGWQVPSLRVLGEINERAYADSGLFTPLVSALRDERVRTYGLRERNRFVCVALTLTLGEDVSIQYVATEAEYRRRGLASRLMLALMADAQSRGAATATLQASSDGISVYERLGFRRVANLNGYLRPVAAG